MRFRATEYEKSVGKSQHKLTVQRASGKRRLQGQKKLDDEHIT